MNNIYIIKKNINLMLCNISVPIGDVITASGQIFYHLWNQCHSFPPKNSGDSPRGLINNILPDVCLICMVSVSIIIFP